MGSLFATVLLDVLPITPLGGTFFWMTHNWGGATPQASRGNFPMSRKSYSPATATRLVSRRASRWTR